MKRLLKYIYFVHSQHKTQNKCILRGVLLKKNPKIPTMGEGVRSLNIFLRHILKMLQ